MKSRRATMRWPQRKWRAKARSGVGEYSEKAAQSLKDREVPPSFIVEIAVPREANAAIKPAAEIKRDGFIYAAFIEFFLKILEDGHVRLEAGQALTSIREGSGGGAGRPARMERIHEVEERSPGLLLKAGFGSDRLE